MIILNEDAPALQASPPVKRRHLKWSGPTLSEISLIHKEGTAVGGWRWGGDLVGELKEVRGEPLFGIRLPWDQLLYGPWCSRNRRWAFAGLNHLLLTRHLGRKPRCGGFMPLPQYRVKEFIGNPMGPEVLGALGKGGMGAWDSDDSYEIGERCNGYRFSSAALAYGATVSEAPKKIADRIRAGRGYRIELRDDPVARQQWQTLRRVEWGAGVWASLNGRLKGAEIVKGICSIMAVDDIRRRHWGLVTDPNTGRLFHNVNRCPRDLRPDLIINGKETGEADHASSQPFYLGVIAYKGDNSAEARAFHGLTCSERFYETFGEWAGLTGLTKDELKNRFYIEVLFGKSFCRGRLWDALQERFPKLAAFITSVKWRNHKELARILQKEEARLVLGIIVPGLTAKGIETLSIHDGLLAHRECLEEVRDYMAAEIERATGYRPLVRIKRTATASPAAGVPPLLVA